MESSSTLTSAAKPIHTNALLQSTIQPNLRLPLRAAIVRVGRGVTGEYDISISLDDLQVSREHARFVLDGDHWLIEDTSRNGTYVNGQLLKTTRQPLQGGERIQIGSTFDYFFRTLELTSPAMTVGAPPVKIPNGLAPNEIPPSAMGIWISPSAAVWRDGICLAVNLSRTEYRLLKHLMQHSGDVCEYEDVIMAVWGNPRDKDSLHELIYRVRRKIEPDPASPKFLIIRSGIGVVFFPKGEPQMN
jgi:hypothetical protein